MDCTNCFRKLACRLLIITPTWCSLLFTVCCIVPWALFHETFLSEILIASLVQKDTNAGCGVVHHAPLMFNSNVGSFKWGDANRHFNIRERKKAGFVICICFWPHMKSNRDVMTSCPHKLASAVRMCWTHFVSLTMCNILFERLCYVKHYEFDAPRIVFLWNCRGNLHSCFYLVESVLRNRNCSTLISLCYCYYIVIFREKPQALLGIYNMRWQDKLTTELVINY